MLRGTGLLLALCLAGTVGVMGTREWRDQFAQQVVKAGRRLQAKEPTTATMAMPTMMAHLPISAKCDAWAGLPEFTLLAVADDGTFSGVAEYYHYDEAMTNKTLIDTNFCYYAAFGYILGEPVMIVASGIGPSTAAICIMELLYCNDEQIKEVIWSGTSGWSPQKGGMLDPEDCSAANNDTQVVRIGDICVSPITYNYVCHKSTWDQTCGGFPNQCSKEEYIFGPDASFLFGPCIFTPNKLRAEMFALSEELLQASAAAPAWPNRTDYLVDWESTYWELAANGTGVEYDYSPDAPPAIFGYRECMEADGQYYSAGPVYEHTGRAWTAYTLNQAFNTTEFTPNNVLAVQAMELIGLAQVLDVYNSVDGVKPIPYTGLRSASNYLMPKPVGTELIPGTANSVSGMWGLVEETPNYDVPKGYAFAIDTYSTAVMNLLRVRCLKKGGDACEFEIVNSESA